MDYLTWANQFFAGDIFATQTTGIQILAVDKHYAKCQLNLNASHKNANNTAMGGAIFTLADFCFAVAANAGDVITVSSSAQIAYLASAKGEQLIAEAVCIKDGRTTCYYEVTIIDEKQKLIAKVTVNGFKTQPPQK